MSTEIPDAPLFVQTPAQEDTPAAEAPKDNGPVQHPDVNYDKYRGQGGDYIVNDEGHRVPLNK